MRTPRIPATLFVSVLLFGCPPGNGEGDGAGGTGGDTASSLPPQAPLCATDFPEDFPATRKVEIGTGTGADFAPYKEGEGAHVYKGGQGLNMITPTIRIEAAPGDPEEACLRVRLEDDYQGAIAGQPDAIDSLQASVHFLKQGTTFVSDGTLYDAFSYSREALIGIDLKLTATVQGPGFEGTATVHVTLE